MQVQTDGERSHEIKGEAQKAGNIELKIQEE